MIFAGILAGGKGTRMDQQAMPKQFLELGNQPILIHTIEKFLMEPRIAQIVVGVHPDWVTYAQTLIDKYLPNSRVIAIPGGDDRNGTIEAIIDYITANFDITDDSFILTHDSVRPFVSLQTIQENIQRIATCDAVDTVVEATDTIVQSFDKEMILDIPDRQFLYQGQTPQTFRLNAFKALYSALNDEQKKTLTDACKIFVLNGKKVAMAKGDYANIKITTITDLKIANSMIED